MIDYDCPKCYEPSSPTGSTSYMGDGAEIERYKCRNGHRWQYVNGIKELRNA